MKKIWILCIDDEPEVLRVVEQELVDFEDVFPVESAQSADEAMELLLDIKSKDEGMGLILCDHVMPGKNGVDLLIELKQDPYFKLSRTVLVTGQAGLDATVRAVNEGELDHYIAKPWKPGKIKDVARNQLTDYVLSAGIDPLPYMKVLETERISELIYKRGLISDE